MKDIIRKIIFKEKCNEETYINHLRKIGMKIGENLYLANFRSIGIDETRPWLIEIGDNVVLTKGVNILTHGYDLSVIMNMTGDLYGSSGKVKIGDNVFIGTNATILKGVTIGNNVIVGAGSLVNKDIPDNCVVAGNPAKKIMSMDDYILKREKESVKEAKELAIEYYKTYGKKPKMKQFHEFFFIMLRREDIDTVDFGFLKIPIVRKRFLETKPIYNGLDEFLKDCGIE